MARTAPKSAILLAALGLLAGCRRPSPATPDAGPADGGVAAVAPPELQLSVRYEAPDGGLVPIPFAPGTRPLIEPTQKLQVGANLGLRNYRIRLFDEADRVLPSDDEVPDGGSALDYRIQLLAPLKTGRRYTLVVDAQSGAAFSDSAGRPQPDQRLEFQTSGEKEKPPASSSRPPRAKKHHR